MKKLNNQTTNLQRSIDADDESKMRKEYPPFEENDDNKFVKAE